MTNGHDKSVLFILPLLWLPLLLQLLPPLLLLLQLLLRLLHYCYCKYTVAWLPSMVLLCFPYSVTKYEVGRQKKMGRIKLERITLDFVFEYINSYCADVLLYYYTLCTRGRKYGQRIFIFGKENVNFREYIILILKYQ